MACPVGPYTRPQATEEIRLSQVPIRKFLQV